MSNRKESLKKSLGITEYPWSSDDDDNPRTNQDQVPASSRYLESDTHISGTNSAGTSSSAISPTRRNPTRLERDLYWSLQNNPNIINAPVPPLRSNNTDILAFTRLTPILEDIYWPTSGQVGNTPTNQEATSGRRHSTTQPNAGNTSTSAASPTRRNQPDTERTSWSEGNQNTDSGPARSRNHQEARDLRLMQVISRLTYNFARRQQYATRRGGASHNVMFNPSMQTNVTAALGTSRIRRRPSHRAPLPSVRSSIISPVMEDESSSTARNNHVQTQNTEQEQNSDDDSDPPMRPTFVIDQNNENNDENTEENIDDSNSREPESMDMDVQLEQDGVEVDGGEDNREGDNDNDNDVEILPDNEEAPEEPTAQDPPAQTSQTVKRRRDTRDNAEPETVKEFNQRLLGLLECPVCLECMEPPMSQCRRGHLVCGRCRARLAACPVCRTAFSSVRNRAMEAVAALLRYPCRHECGRLAGRARRAAHEPSCAARRLRCPAPPCAAPPLPLPALAAHVSAEHAALLKHGRKHKFSVRMITTYFKNWFVMVDRDLFHLHVDVDARALGVLVYVAYIGPKCNASRFVYEVTVTGEQKNRKLIYTRSTHSDLESSSLNDSRQDCFHLPLAQANNFLKLRGTKRNSRELDKFFDFTVDISKCEEPAESVAEEPDS